MLFLLLMEGWVKMINKLIDMTVYPITYEKEEVIQNNGVYTIEDYARAFINGMGETQKARFRKMLENNIKCGLSVAQNYDVDYDEFITEVKKQMEV